MIELENRYLARKLPEGLKNCKSKEIIDIYFPKSDPHPKLRIRKDGDKYEATKKEPIRGDAKSFGFEEQTIILTENEFKDLLQIDGRKVHKIRYYYDHKGRTAQIDVFQGPLKGLVIVDFEFETMEEKNSFEIPDFCLANITGEEFTAGGYICGRSYEDIKEVLNKFSYAKLFLD